MKKNLFPALFCMILAVIPQAIFAENEKPEYSPWKITFSERIRWEGWDNAVSLDRDPGDSNSYNRTRTSLGVEWRPSTRFEAAVKLTNEFRVYMAPKNREFNLNELIFDNLYFKWKPSSRLPLTVTMGRQNFRFGEGFIVMDGNPLDGSRTAYFNALKLDWQWNPVHRLSLFTVYMPETDNILPRINDREQALIEQPETGIGLYYSAAWKRFHLDGYFIHKIIGDTENRPIRSAFETLGARTAWTLTPSFSLTAEGAYQFGSYGDFRRRGFGGLAHADLQLTGVRPLKSVTFGAVLLSGDDPETERMEGWDPLFSRWPKWSESYIYTQVQENGPAYWSNFSSFYTAVVLDLMENLDALFTCHFLGALQPAGEGFPGGSGKGRGTLFIGRLNFRINKNLSGHFLWEHFRPGSFYFDSAASSNWLRFELLFSL